VSAYPAGAYTATLRVMVNVIKGGGRAPPPSPPRANFTLMTECTPESSGCNSVYSVTWHQIPQSRKTYGGKNPVFKPVCRDSSEIYHILLQISLEKSRFLLPTILDQLSKNIVLEPRCTEPEVVNLLRLMACCKIVAGTRIIVVAQVAGICKMAAGTSTM
jgi:hypothetical protein